MLFLYCSTASELNILSNNGNWKWKENGKSCLGLEYLPTFYHELSMRNGNRWYIWCIKKWFLLRGGPGGVRVYCLHFIVEIPRGMGKLRFKNVFKWSERFLLRLPIGIHGNIPLSAWRHHLFVRLRKELEIENRMLNCPDRNERNYGMEHYHNSNFQELGQDISNTRSAPLCLQQVFKGCGGYGT